MIWITSDQHFSHKNIIKYCNRPLDINDPDCTFKMNNLLVERWNERVQPNDVVYFLGDFAWTKGAFFVEKLMNRLNGSIHFAMGNHDSHDIYDYHGMPGTKVIEIANHFVLDNDYLLVHYPARETMPAEFDNTNVVVKPFKQQRMFDKLMQQNKRIEKLREVTGCKYIVHGHVHNSIKENYPNHFNVSCDAHDFYPVSFDEIKKDLKTRNAAQN